MSRPSRAGLQQMNAAEHNRHKTEKAIGKYASMMHAIANIADDEAGRARAILFQQVANGKLTGLVHDRNKYMPATVSAYRKHYEIRKKKFMAERHIPNDQLTQQDIDTLARLAALDVRSESSTSPT